jgi:WD40 repeat protein
MDDMRNEVPDKLDLNNRYIADTAMTIAKNYPGEYNINQVCAIYDTMARGGWFYYSEANGEDYFQNANNTLINGKISDTIGRGDCDDFAILMASLIDSLGGSTRITFAWDIQKKESHAYSEVYLGRKDDPATKDLIKWIEDEYGLEKIPGLNETGDEFWLNLDWGSNHPGGIYFGNNSKTVKSAIIFNPSSRIAPRIIPMIDRMESAESWNLTMDGAGSSIKAYNTPAKGGTALKISYNLLQNGWVGISKEVDPEVLKKAVGINFSCLIMDSPNSIEMRLIYENKTTFGFTWSGLDREKWLHLRALFSDFKCISSVKNGNALRERLEPDKVRTMEFIIFNNADEVDEPGSGTVIIDRVQGTMAIPVGSPWARAEENRQIAIAQNLLADSQLVVKKGDLLSRKILLEIESMRHHPSWEASRLLSEDMGLLPYPVAIMDHESVEDIVFSQDGRYIASIDIISPYEFYQGDPKETKVWESATGRLISTIPNEGLAYAFSRNGTYLATACNNNSTQVWQTIFEKNICNITQSAEVNAIAFSQDEKLIATVGEDNSLKICNIETGNIIAQKFLNMTVKAVAFSADGCQTIIAGKSKALIFDSRTGQEISYNISLSDPSYFASERNKDNSIIFKGNEKCLIALIRDNTTNAQNITAQPYESYIIYNRSEDFYDPGPLSAFSIDGKYIATAISGKRTAQVIDVSSGSEVTRITHDDYVEAIAFSPDGKYIATASSDNTARVWNATTGEEVSRAIHDEGVNEVAFSPDGRYLATASFDDTVRIWRLPVDDEIGYIGPVNAVAFSDDGAYLAASSDDGYTRIWNTSSNSEVAHIFRKGGMNGVAFSPDGSYIVVASNDTLEIWDFLNDHVLSTFIDDGKLIQGITIGFPYYSTIDFALSPDGKTIATANYESILHIWDVSNHSEIYKLNHSQRINDFIYSMDGKRIATASIDGTSRVWEPASGRKIITMNHGGSVYKIRFSPNGRYIATASYVEFPAHKWEVRIWNSMNGAEVSRVTYDTYFQDISFSPNGKYLGIASDGGILKVLEIPTGIEILNEVQKGRISKIIFSPDGNYLATIGWDDDTQWWSVWIWEMPGGRGKEVFRFVQDTYINDISFSPDGMYLAIGGGSLISNEVRNLRLCIWRPEDLIAEACSRLNRNLTREEWKQYLGDEPYRETCPCQSHSFSEGR